jgi:hypothetical protein
MDGYRMVDEMDGIRRRTYLWMDKGIVSWMDRWTDG